MAISLIKRPIGHKIAVAAHDGSVVDSAGDAAVYTGSAHGLVDGDYIFIDSNIDAYNGFRYVDSVSYDTFKIKESENGEYIQFKQAVDITFYISVLNHYWQCVHLPIVYELESDISPSNVDEESYLPNTVVSYSNNAGYVQLNLAQALSDPEELTKIELVGGTMAGVYQILTVLQPWSVVIDLVYSASYSFTGSVVVKYYDNYAINVNVYAGFESGHPWESVKPFELAATLRFIPDDNNQVKFSIAEILKGYIETRNKLDLDTLPNNTDFMVSFYIAYFETYDESDGEEITTFTGSVTTDTVTGYAVNAMLPFKNMNSGHMSEYVSVENYPAPWLTLFDRPIIIIDHFFDLSFINQFDGDITITNFKSLDGVVLETEITTLTNPGKGILRVPLAGESGFDQYCVQASTVGQPEIPGVTSAITLPPLSSGVNIAGPNTNWVTGANPSLSFSGVGGKQSDVWANDYPFVAGYDYTFNPSIDFAFDANSSLCRIRFHLLNSSNVIVLNINFDFLPGATGTLTTPILFEGISGAVKFGFSVISTSLLSVTENFDINSITATQTTPATPAVEAQIITEQLCLDVISECDSTHLTNEYRLTQGGDLRELE